MIIIFLMILYILISIYKSSNMLNSQTENEPMTQVLHNQKKI